MRNKLFMVIICMILLTGCKTAETSLGIGDKVTVELETFTLTDAAVVTDSAASGGKAVEIMYITSKLKGEVKLPAGTYRLTVYENAPDKSTDAIYIQINNLTPLRMSVNAHGAYKPCDRTVTISVVDEEIPVNVTITPSEIQMRIDKLEFEKLE
ncbi:MAG: hypothetical protein JW822_12770 [Spirochaetales bacterium]|nr:hypothetical protein [Spirochaetales bacterium]